jgi:hypothetical protein
LLPWVAGIVSAIIKGFNEEKERKGAAVKAKNRISFF